MIYLFKMWELPTLAAHSLDNPSTHQQDWIHMKKKQKLKTYIHVGSVEYFIQMCVIRPLLDVTHSDYDIIE